jgi:hypothetical protein
MTLAPWIGGRCRRRYRITMGPNRPPLSSPFSSTEEKAITLPDRRCIRSLCYNVLERLIPTVLHTEVKAVYEQEDYRN